MKNMHTNHQDHAARPALTPVADRSPGLLSLAAMDVVHGVFSETVASRVLFNEMPDAYMAAMLVSTDGQPLALQQVDIEPIIERHSSDIVAGLTRTSLALLSDVHPEGRRFRRAYGFRPNVVVEVIRYDALEVDELENDNWPLEEAPVELMAMAYHTRQGSSLVLHSLLPVGEDGQAAMCHMPFDERIDEVAAMRQILAPRSSSQEAAKLALKPFTPNGSQAGNRSARRRND